MKLIPILMSLSLVAASFAQPTPTISPELDVAAKSVVFRLKAPKAQEVNVHCQWLGKPTAMSRSDDGVWSASLTDVPSGVWEYGFNVDGVAMIDPANIAQKPQRSPTTSILHVPSTPPASWDFQDIPHGTVHRHNYLSKSLGKQRELWVYTPPGYETEKGNTYPLLVLQHGSGDNQRTWVEHGKAHWIIDSLIATGKATPMVVVMLDGHPLGMVPRDQADRREASMQAFQDDLFKDALPLVEARYRLAQGPENRGIVGLSMGGWHSLTIGLNHQDRFNWIGSFSGAVDEAAIKTALDDAKGTNDRLKLLWIACGKEDFLLERNTQLIDTLKSRGIKHEWVLSEGGHSWPVWRSYLTEFVPKLFH
ncbi:MAG: esterase [Verrucomicrobiaceae bacterium]|nr:esterase [Verrucomicrobiaceae bacterium]